MARSCHLETSACGDSVSEPGNACLVPFKLKFGARNSFIEPTFYFDQQFRSRLSSESLTAGHSSFGPYSLPPLPSCTIWLIAKSSNNVYGHL